MTASIPLGSPDRWDYVVFDGNTHRVYVAHGDRVTVVDAATRKIVGEVEGIPGGTHGVAISAATGQGFTDDGKNGKAIAFDLKTLMVTHDIPADVDADAIAFDRMTGRVFVIEGDPGAITVIDPKSDSAVATIKAGEKMEYGVSDDRATIYVAGEERGDLLKIDARTNNVVAQWPAAGCTSPHGLAIDKVGRRLFMGCTNSVMMVMSADDGRVVATLPIGKGNDPTRKRVFSSNGIDGTISVYQQSNPDTYAPLEPLATAVSGRTMAVDPTSGRLFVVAADTYPSTTPGARPHVRPGTLKLLVADPID
jgi:DNA-binding beta-propeller fold protein YncE